MTDAQQTIRIGIVGYGNLGRGAERAIAANADMKLVGIYTRRPSADLVPSSGSTPVFALDALEQHRGDLDVLLLCGGSRDDLPVQSPRLAEHFCIVDSFDTHARVPEHYAAVDQAARRGGYTALIAAGWDPGLFSLQRMFGEALLPNGTSYTFWGPGLSQGHSDAIRRVPGVAAGVQYTMPADEAIKRVRSGVDPELTTRDKHRRVCYVVLDDGADPEAVREAITTMPHYFDEYDTTVNFIDAEELAREHQAMPHGGFVFRSGQTSATHRQVIEYRLQLDSNPEFTASVLAAYARAVFRLHRRGEHGARTVFDVAPGLLSPLEPDELRKRYL